MANFNDYFANMGTNALQGAQAVGNALTQRRDIQNRMTLQGQLPALIEQYGVSNRNMPEEQKQANKQYLSLLANTNPEEAMKYLMQIQRESSQTRNLDAISMAIGEGLQAYKNAFSILRDARMSNKSEDQSMMDAYNQEYDKWKSAMIKASQAGATSEQLNAVGKLGAYEDYFNEKRKQELSAKKAETEYSTAQLQNKVAEANTKLIPITSASAQVDLTNKKLETKSKVQGIEEKKIGANLEKDKFIANLDLFVNKMNSLATEYKNLFSTDPRKVNSAKNAITKLFARKFSDEALSGGEYAQATGATGIESILNRISAGAMNLEQMSDDQARSTARDLYKSYADGLTQVKSRASKAFGTNLSPSMNPMPLVGGSAQGAQGGGAQPQTPNARVSKKGRSS